MPTFAETMLRSTPARAIAASAGVPSPFQGLASLLRGSQMADTSLEEAKARRRYVSEARELAQKVGVEWTTDIYKFVSDATPGIMLDEPSPGQKPTAEHDRQMKARIERDTARLSAARHRNVALPVQVAERVGNELALGFPAAMSPEIMSGSSLEDSSNPVKKYGAKGALKAADLVGMILAAKGIGGLTGLGGTASFSAQMGVQGAAPGIVAGNVGEAIGGGAAGAVEGAGLGKALGMVPQAGSALGRTAASAGTFGGLELLDPNASPEDILLAMAAGGFAHGVTSEIPGKIGARRAEKAARLERAASEAKRQRDLASVLAEYRGEQQANEAFAEAGSRSPEVFVGEKGKIRQIPVRVPFKEYKAAKAKLAEQGAYQAGELVTGERPGSMVPTPLSLADKAALELMDAASEARTAPYEGPKAPLLRGLSDLVSETPAMARERIRLERLEMIPDAAANERAGMHPIEESPHAAWQRAVDEFRTAAEARGEIPIPVAEDVPNPRVGWTEVAMTAPEDAAALAPSLAIPGLRRPGSVIDPTARGEAGGPIEVVPGGSGEAIGAPAMRRPGQTNRPELPLNTAEELGRAIVDEELRTYKGDLVPLNAPEFGGSLAPGLGGGLGGHNPITGPSALLKPGFLRTAEDRIPPDSQDARSETPPPEAPIVPTAEVPPAPPEQSVPVGEQIAKIPDDMIVFTPQEKERLFLDNLSKTLNDFDYNSDRDMSVLKYAIDHYKRLRAAKRESDQIVNEGISPATTTYRPTAPVEPPAPKPKRRPGQKKPKAAPENKGLSSPVIDEKPVVAAEDIRTPGADVGGASALRVGEKAGQVPDVIRSIIDRETAKGMAAWWDGANLRTESGKKYRADGSVESNLSPYGVEKGVREIEGSPEYFAYNDRALSLAQEATARIESERVAKDAEERTKRQEDDQKRSADYERRAKLDAQSDMTGWKKSTMSMYTGQGPKPTEGYERRGLFIHKDPGMKTWKVSHSSSGKHIGVERESLTDAKFVADRLSREADWTSPESEVMKDSAHLGSAVTALRRSWASGGKYEFDNYAEIPERAPPAGPKTKKRPGKKKTADGDVTLGTMGGALEDFGLMARQVAKRLAERRGREYDERPDRITDATGRSDTMGGFSPDHDVHVWHGSPYVFDGPVVPGMSQGQGGKNPHMASHGGTWYTNDPSAAREYANNKLSGENRQVKEIALPAGSRFMDIKGASDEAWSDFVAQLKLAGSGKSVFMGYYGPENKQMRFVPFSEWLDGTSQYWGREELITYMESHQGKTEPTFQILQGALSRSGFHGVMIREDTHSPRRLDSKMRPISDGDVFVVTDPLIDNRIRNHTVYTPNGDVTLGTMGGGLEGARKAFRRPGQRKPSEEKRPGVKKDNILAAAFLPAEVQIARQSPEARKVAEMLHAGKYDPKQSGGRFARALVEYRASSMTPEESVSIGQSIQGFKDPETLTPKARKLMDVTRRYLKEIAIKSGGVGMKLYTAAGKRVAFPGPNEKFFPHIPVKTEDLKVGGEARERVIKNSVAIRAFETEAEAGEMLDSYVDIAENGLHARNKKMAERLMERGKADSVEQAVALIEGNRREGGPQRFGSLEHAREFDNPFYEPDFNKAMTQYSREAERRISETKNWGQDNERLKEAIADIHDKSKRQGVAITAETAKGVVQKGSKPIDDAAIVMRRFGSYMMSPLSAIRNTGQVDNSFLLTDFKSVIKAINLNRESRLRAIESGATSGPVLHDVEMGKGGAPSYQKIIGQTGTEVLLRTHANNAGMNYFHDYVDRIRKNPNDAFAAKELRKMGQDPADLATGRELTRTDYNKAGFNIAARGQFMYDELDVPAWFNATQPGKTVSQFRPWLVQQSHLIYDETVGQWRGGTIEGKMRCLRNIGLLATLYPLRGEVLNDFVALLQGKKRESNLFLRYLEDAAHMGVLTVVYEAYNVVQYNNAEGLMMGASLSKAKDMAKIAGALAKNGKLSYSEQRLVFRMVPIIGPLFAYHVVPKSNEEGAESEGPKGRPGRVRPGSSRPGTRRPGRTRPARN